MTSHRIAVIIHALHGGGAERVTAQLANHWAACGHAVVLITLDTIESDHYRVDQRVQRIGFGMMRTSRNWRQAVTDNIGRLRRLRRAVQQVNPTCIVSATDRMNVMTLLACRPFGVPIAITEHIDPRHQPLPRPWEWLRGRTYRRASVAVALTEDIARYLHSRWRVRETCVIPNGVVPPDPTVCLPPEQRNKTLLAMGRLARQKGFDLLLQAFARIAPEWPDWNLRILGEGPERVALEARSSEYGLQSRVELPGWVDDPATELGRAALFILSSRYEGFPVVLLEALACGTPVISFDCQSGPAEIIRHGIDGLLVPAGDVAALAAAIAELLGAPAQRVALGHRASEVAARFSLEKFYARWDTLLEHLLDGSDSSLTT